MPGSNERKSAESGSDRRGVPRRVRGKFALRLSGDDDEHRCQRDEEGRGGGMEMKMETEDERREEQEDRISREKF